MTRAKQDQAGAAKQQIPARRAYGHGQSEPRGLEYQAFESCESCDCECTTARFGRMFPMLPPGHEYSDAELAVAASSMRADGDIDSELPAGFTYFGQFLDHDITLDATALSDAERDPRAVVNFRTPALDLDSVYGQGPVVTPWLYDLDGVHLAIGEPDRTVPNAGDLLRRADGIPLIGDPRNDENLAVAQIHLSMVRLHNRVVDELIAAGAPPEGLFGRARDTVRWHYQWAVVHDYLRRICGAAVVQDVLENGNRWYRPGRDAFMPVEFAVAAFRFGHTMVRDDYPRFNIPFSPASLSQLFHFTGTNTPPGPGSVAHNGWRMAPDDWENLFEGGRVAPVFAARIDALLAPTLFTLAGMNPGELALRNLIRGRRFRLPSGQAVARLLGEVPLTAAQVTGTHRLPAGFADNTPLWFYVLREGAERAGGNGLGPVGARILAEVFIGMLRADCSSYLHQRQVCDEDAPPVRERLAALARGLKVPVARIRELPVAAPYSRFQPGRHLDPSLLAHACAWRPSLPARSSGSFTVADLIRYANGLT